MPDSLSFWEVEEIVREIALKMKWGQASRGQWGRKGNVCITFDDKDKFLKK